MGWGGKPKGRQSYQNKAKRRKKSRMVFEDWLSLWTASAIVDGIQYTDVKASARSESQAYREIKKRIMDLVNSDNQVYIHFKDLTINWVERPRILREGL